MPPCTRAFAVLAVLTIPLAVGCARGTSSQRANQAPRPPSSTAAPTQSEVVTPIPAHPPVTTSGVVASVDPAAGIVAFRDGRRMKLTDTSKVLQPVDPRAVRPGEAVVVRDALPMAMQTASAPAAAARRQKMATVASVDHANGLVHTMDGDVVRVTPDTKMHTGTTGPAMVLTDLRPGDELIIVMIDEPAPVTSAPSGAGTSTTSGTRATTGGVATAPSALPRAAAGVPRTASELMVFRRQAP
jgi:hypothetical protein